MKDTRLTPKEAGYMELEGAYKGADCHKVNVPGGISLQLGCCNEFKPEATHTQSFKCGTCKFKRL
jgi:hypothetical protein